MTPRGDGELAVWDNGEPPPAESTKPESQPNAASVKNKPATAESETAGVDRQPPKDKGLAAPAPKAARVSESELMEAFVDRYGDDWRYVAELGKFYQFTGNGWVEDNQLVIRDRVRKHCARNGEGSGRTSAAVFNFLKADEKKIAASVNQWDRDPWLLGTPSGTVNLRWGTLRPADRADYITKSTAVTPDGDCPMFMKFLNEATGGDPELQAYLQRKAGYFLTGSIEEHAMFFAHGDGGTGKGTYSRALLGVMGDYGQTAPISTFMASKNEQHPTDLAGLRGARLVVASETEEGRSWAEAKIKSITGGDPITARFMRQDFITYQPNFKLMITGNHRPRFGSVDNSMRRRFNLIPFNVIPETPDVKLDEKIKTEYAGVLKWMLAGCLMWRQDRLSPPAAVIDATTNYFTDNDKVALWLEDCCIVDNNPQTRTKRDELFMSWSWWAEARNEFVGKSAQFYEALEKKGFRPAKIDGDRFFKGLKLGKDEEAEAEARAGWVNGLRRILGGFRTK